MGRGYSDLVISIAYSLPHVISASAGVIFAGYIGLLYINTYKWKSEDFGKIYSFYFISTSFCLFVFSLVLQFVVTSTEEVIGLRNCKIAQVINISLHASKSFHDVVTLFCIIFLPVLKFKRDDRIYALENGENVAPEVNDQQSEKRSGCTIASKVFDNKYYVMIVYLLFFVHAYGWGSYEICDRLLPTYMTKDATYLSSTNSLIRSLFVFITPLAIMVFIKLLGKKYPDYNIYLGISAFLVFLLIPISVLFFIFTQKSTSSASTQVSDYVPETANPDYPVLVALALLDVISPLLYLSCPAIIQYISTHLLEDDANNFRICASTLFLLFYFLGSVFYKGFNQIVTLPKKTIGYIVIVCNSIGYLLLFPHRFPWNKKGITYYVILCTFNIFIMAGFINTGIMMANQLADDNHKKYRWLLQGITFLLKNSVISFLMRVIYKTYGKEQQLKAAMEDKESNRGESQDPPTSPEGDGKAYGLPNIKLSFPNLFRVIFLTCQITGLICLSVYKEHKFE